METCIAPSGIVEATPQGRGFQDRSSLGSGPVSKAYHVFRNGDLASTSERQPEATAITYNIWVASGAPLTNSLKRGLLSPGAELFAKWSIALRGSTVSPEIVFI